MTPVRSLRTGLLAMLLLAAVNFSLPGHSASAQTGDPFIEVSAGRDFVCASDFPSGAELSLTILDPTKTQTVFEGSRTASASTTCWTVDDTGVDLVADMFVTVTDLAFVRQATVVEGALGAWPGGLFADYVAAATEAGTVAIYGGAPGANIIYVIEAPDFVNSAFTEAYASGFDPSVIEVSLVDADGDRLLFPLYSSTFTLVSPNDDAPIPYFATPLPSAGVAITVWGGGPVTGAAAAAMQRGCTLRSLWVTSAGSLTGYVVGAPGFVNEEFLNVFPNGALAPGQGTLLVCGA